jgi:UDP-2,3-diacylglucosamine pyrophosphatase LpxH
MAKTLVATSDQHTDSAPPAVQAAQLKFFRSLIDRADVPCVVSVGDLWSMTLDSSVDTVIKSSHCAKVRDVLRQLSESKVVALVDGNHDPYSTMPKPELKRFTDWLAAPKIMFPGRGFNKRFAGLPTAYFMHGSQFDPTTDMWKVLTGALRGIVGAQRAEAFAKWVVGIWLKRKSGPTPAMVRDQDPDAYAQLVSYMHEEMWKWTLDKKNGYDICAMGHTHFDECRHKELSNKTYVNCGAFDGNGNTYVEITADGARLVEW